LLSSPSRSMPADAKRADPGAGVDVSRPTSRVRSKMTRVAAIINTGECRVLNQG
jgi:hypothetical protein